MESTQPEENKDHHDEELKQLQKVRKIPSVVIAEIVKCDSDDDDAIKEQADPENFDQVLELQQVNIEAMVAAGKKPQLRKSVSGTHKEVIKIAVDNIGQLDQQKELPIGLYEQSPLEGKLKKGLG